jgi:hypothetical protein
MKKYIKGIGFPGIYRGKLKNQRNFKALWVPRPSSLVRIKPGHQPKVSFYNGPPEKQKNPRAINMYNAKKIKKK